MKEFIPRSVEDLQAEWPPELDHVSATSLKMLARCPEQWRRRYLLNERVPPGAALIQGRADHAALALNFEHKLREGEDLPVEAVVAEFADSFDLEIDMEGGYDEVDWETDGDPRKAAGQIKDAGCKLVREYCVTASPWIAPIAVEEDFTIPAGSLPLNVTGRIDVVAYDLIPMPDGSFVAEPDTEKIIERKTTKTTKVNPDWRLQAGIYQLTRPLPVDFHMSLKRKEPQVLWGSPELRVNVTDLPRTALLVQQMARMLGSFYQAYGPDFPWPGTGLAHPWACGYCGYEPTCTWRH